MPKDLTLCVLLDIYGDLLPPKQRQLCELYYNEDLSLAEISENEGITRQGARDAIKRAEQQLHAFEDALGLNLKFSQLQAEAAEVKAGKDPSLLCSIIDNI